MIFKTGERSQLSVFISCWGKAGCWELADFRQDCSCWEQDNFFSKHFTWGDELCVNSSWGHWSKEI